MNCYVLGVGCSSSEAELSFVSSSDGMAPAIIMSIVLVPVPVSMPVGHLGGNAVAVRVAAAPVLGSALPTRVASRSVRSLHAGHG